MKSKWNRSKDQRRLDEKKDKEKKYKEKKYRVYLAEPLDYFGVVQQQKIRERQRLEKRAETNGLISSWQTVNNNSTTENPPDYDISNIPIIGIGTEPTRNLGEDHLRILRRSIYCDQRNRTGSESERRPHRKTAVSIPLREVLATRIKSYVHRLTKWKAGLTSSTTSSSPMNSPQMEHSRFLPLDSPRSLRSRQSRTTSTSSTTFSIDSSSTDDYEQGRHVHFAPNTVFCERDENSPFWSSFFHRRRLKAEEEEEKNRPRPFLPLLESGLSYRNDAEFYRLKSISALKDPQLIFQECELQQRQRRHGKNKYWSLPWLTSPLRRTFCCFLPSSVNEYTGQGNRSPHLL